MALLDVAIIGAGPVGAALAGMLARDGLATALYEAREAASTEGRLLALSHGSRELLAGFGAWPEGATPITSIHVSQRGGPGRLLLEAAEQGVPALGYTLRYSELDAALRGRLHAVGTPVHFGERCETIVLRPDAALVGFSSGLRIEARLLVLADGGANATRIPGIAFEGRDYRQAAVLGLVTADRPHRGRAYERFTPDGPMALLPTADRYALVWTASPQQAEALLELAPGPFLSRLQEAFGDRAGRFGSIEARMSFPLRLRCVNTPVAMRTAIVGNAAQALHPIAGQGLNLGLRDAAALAMAIRGAPRGDPGCNQMLMAYRDARRRDAGRGVAFTDMLVRTFADARRLPTWGRGAAMTVLDLVPAARRRFAERMLYGASAS